jgi:hypothetical protein
VSAAFFLFASLLGLAPALTIVGGPLVHGLTLAIVAAAVGITAATLNDDDLDQMTRLVRPITPLVLALSIWMLLQISPFPGRWLANPVWSSATAALGGLKGGLISIDVGSTLLSFARYCQVIGIAALATALALDRRRAEGIFILTTTVSAIIAALAIFADLGYLYSPAGLARAGSRAEGLNVAVIGVILASATAIHARERYRSTRSPSGKSTWPLAAFSAAVFVVCLSAILAKPTRIGIFAALFGLGTLSAVLVARRLRLGRWGQAGIAAIAFVAAAGFVVTSSAPREMDATLMLATGSQASLAIADRMLFDVTWTGSGAGTFDALVPIYRTISAASEVVTAPTAAASISIELGVPALWILTICALTAALLLFKGALRRGRDYFYPAAGAACVLAIVILSFGNAGIFGWAPAALASVACGVALAQSPHSAENMPAPSSARTWSRVALMSFCVVCALQAAWIVVPELQRRGTIYMPVDARAASIARFERDNAERAAGYALVRGDLWAESAFTYSGLLWTDATKPVEPSIGLEQNRAMTDLERALKYSPHRGDVWLLLAGLSQRYDWSGFDPASLLKMSFYTAPNELALVPQRIMVAARTTGIEDQEIQDMIKRDIRLLLARGADPNTVLAAAYRNASAKNRPFIERFVSEIDPRSAASMRQALN